jgi:hypothetical protein
MTTWQGRAPVIGIVAILLFVAAFAVGGETPGADDPVTEVISFYKSNDTEMQVTAGLLAFGAAAFVLFSCILAARIRGAAARVSSTANGILAGGILIGLGWLIFAGLSFTLGDAVDHLDPVGIQTLNALNSDFWLPIAAGNAVFAWSVALGVLRHGALPSWLGWAALVIAVAAVTPAGFFAVPAIGIWTLVASVVMLTERSAPVVAPAA